MDGAIRPIKEPLLRRLARTARHSMHNITTTVTRRKLSVQIEAHTAARSQLAVDIAPTTVVPAAARVARLAAICMHVRRIELTLHLGRPHWALWIAIDAANLAAAAAHRDRRRVCRLPALEQPAAREWNALYPCLRDGDDLLI